MGVDLAALRWLAATCSMPRSELCHLAVCSRQLGELSGNAIDVLTGRDKGQQLINPCIQPDGPHDQNVALLFCSFLKLGSINSS